MKQRNLLAYATTAWLAVLVVVAGYHLLRTMMPSADVPDPRALSPIRSVSISDMEPGEVRHVLLDDTPITIWRRSFEQKVQALEQLGMVVGDDPGLLEAIRTTAEYELEPGRMLRFEWFVVSPINIGGYGCLSLADAGDFDGFFDPCQDVHFDLWGRVRQGPTDANLAIPPWSISDDGQFIIIDISDSPAER